MIAALLTLLLVLVTPSQATTTVTFCVKLDKELTGLGTDFGGDFWTSNTPHSNGFGIDLAVIENVDPPVVVFSGYTDTSTGCSPQLGLDPAKEYLVHSASKAELDGGNTVYVRDNADNYDLYEAWYYSEVSPYVPPGSGPVTVDVVAPPGAAKDNLAMGIRALYRWPGELTNESIDIFAESPAAALVGAYSAGGDVYLWNEDHKYLVMHEIGHAIAWLRDESSPFLRWYDLEMDGCYTFENGNHHMNSKEYLSTAIIEGFAHFYASVMWNSIAQSNCDFVYWAAVDWNLDETNNEFDDGDSFVCFGDPCVTTADCADPGFLDDDDWLYDLVVASDVQGCTGTTTNRSTEYDVMRFFWALIIEAGWGAGDVLDLYDGADPNDWDPNEDTLTGADDPYPRLWDSAYDMGGTFLDEFLDHIDHGIY